MAGGRRKRLIIIFLCIAACLFGTLREEARANSQAYHISIAWLELAQMICFSVLRHKRWQPTNYADLISPEVCRVISIAYPCTWQSFPVARYMKPTHVFLYRL